MPGYILHLTEAKLIEDRIREGVGPELPPAWWNAFRLGCLLPDTRRRREKAGSHFWAPETLADLAIAPSLERFLDEYGGRLRGPGMLGYWVHLHLDFCYVREFWTEHFRFLGEHGEEEVLRERVKRVLSRMSGKTLPVDEFFSDRGYYGDYTRMNAFFSEKYYLQVPQYLAEDWTDFPIAEVDPSGLCEVLNELRALLAKEQIYAGEELVVFDRDELDSFVAGIADRALEMILPALKEESAGLMLKRQIII